mmetsp:Transcript_35667/g.55689  ORF Transcript_35667/g.55689 Transcript_35667/m.55689 type:complete len:215 (-) Transcript_35667:188-832(-)
MARHPHAWAVSAGRGRARRTGRSLQTHRRNASWTSESTRTSESHWTNRSRGTHRTLGTWGTCGSGDGLKSVDLVGHHVLLVKQCVLLALQVLDHFAVGHHVSCESLDDTLIAGLGTLRRLLRSGILLSWLRLHGPRGVAKVVGICLCVLPDSFVDCSLHRSGYVGSARAFRQLLRLSTGAVELVGKCPSTHAQGAGPSSDPQPAPSCARRHIGG